MFFLRKLISKYRYCFHFIWKWLGVGFLFFLIFSCNQKSSNVDIDTPTTGHITIVADECLKPIIDSEYQVFSSIYKYAVINFVYAPESELFNYVVKDSAQAMIIARKLNKEEESYFEKIKILPRSTRIAIDAIALISNKENIESSLTYDQLRKLISGEYKLWKDVDAKLNLGDINIVFDNAQSGTVRYMLENLNNNKPLPKNCFAVKTNPDVIDYVSKNINALGLIGVSWVSNGNDPKVLSFLDKINVLALTNPKDTVGKSGEFYQPFQAYIALKQYPLIRDIYVISAQGRNGLATGFAAFVASDKGQRIILKAGIMPATQPVRIVNLK